MARHTRRRISRRDARLQGGKPPQQDGKDVTPRILYRLFFLRRNLGYRLVCRTWGHSFEWRESTPPDLDGLRFGLRCRRCHGIGFRTVQVSNASLARHDYGGHSREVLVRRALEDGLAASWCEQRRAPLGEPPPLIESNKISENPDEHTYPA